MLDKNYESQDSKQMFFTRAHNTLPGDTQSVGRGIAGIKEANGIGWSKDVVKKVPYYADQIPPFDITVTFVNEY
jgi:hypothetical protein